MYLNRSFNHAIAKTVCYIEIRKGLDDPIGFWLFDFYGSLWFYLPMYNLFLLSELLFWRTMMHMYARLCRGIFLKLHLRNRAYICRSLCMLVTSQVKIFVYTY